MRVFSRVIFGFVEWAARNGLAAETRAGRQPTRNALARRRTGVRGETFAYWYLRRHGYTIVARNFTVPGDQGGDRPGRLRRRRAGIRRSENAHGRTGRARLAGRRGHAGQAPQPFPHGAAVPGRTAHSRGAVPLRRGGHRVRGRVAARWCACTRERLLTDRMRVLRRPLCGVAAAALN